MSNSDIEHGNRTWINPTHEIINGDRKAIYSYCVWRDMLNRCRENSSEQRRNPSYVGCSIHNSWLSYDIWLEWAKNQIGFNQFDCFGNYFQLDKDILFKGNKHYSPETCVFVPAALNTFLLRSKKARGKYPIGVSWHTTNKKFVASIKNGTKLIHLGSFTDPYSAFLSYKAKKKEYAKDIALKYKDVVDKKVIEALNNYEVDIND